MSEETKPSFYLSERWDNLLDQMVQRTLRSTAVGSVFSLLMFRKFGLGARS